MRIKAAQRKMKLKDGEKHIFNDIFEQLNQACPRSASQYNFQLHGPIHAILSFIFFKAV